MLGRTHSRESAGENEIITTPIYHGLTNEDDDSANKTIKCMPSPIETNSGFNSELFQGNTPCSPLFNLASGLMNFGKSESSSSEAKPTIKGSSLMRDSSPSRFCSSPQPPGRTPSPKLEPLATKMRADKIDALPLGARTPKKMPTLASPALDSQTTPQTLGHPKRTDLDPLPLFSNVDHREWPQLFSQKALQCERMFNFSLPFCDIRNKEQKAAALQDLILVVGGHGVFLQEQQYRELIQIFSKNVFRPLASPQNPCGDAFDPEDDEPVYDPSWPHLHLVYELLIRLLEMQCFNLNWAKNYIDTVFMHRLLGVFDVEDPRERELAKMAVHRIYAKFLNLRAFIRKSMRNIFYEFIYEDERHNVAEMLEILGSVVNGFAVPLRDEHKTFLERTLIPLHKNRALPLYYSQLSLCVVQFAEKDSSLTTKIILGLLKFWPKTNTTKQLMFLNEMEEILDVTPAERFITFLIPLMRQLATCIRSSHFQVAERALQFLNNEYIVNVISGQSPITMPILLPAMLCYTRNHWNKNVQMQVFNGIRLFMELDPRLYEQIASRYASMNSPSGSIEAPEGFGLPQQEASLEERQSKEAKWRVIEQVAKQKIGNEPMPSITSQAFIMEESNRMIVDSEISIVMVSSAVGTAPISPMYGASTSPDVDSTMATDQNTEGVSLSTNSDGGGKNPSEDKFGESASAQNTPDLDSVGQGQGQQRRESYSSVVAKHAV